jgi:competence CoiA-like predicted nuclease
LFEDKKGSLIPFTFTLSNKEFLNVEKQFYTKSIGEYDSATRSVTYNSTDRAKVNFYSDESRRYTATSNWISETNCDFLEEMISSKNVYWYKDLTTYIPINIITNSYPKKKRTDATLINITIEFETAVNI